MIKYFVDRWASPTMQTLSYQQSPKQQFQPMEKLARPPRGRETNVSPQCDYMIKMAESSRRMSSAPFLEDSPSRWS
ncbi:hypothetical protein BJX66DRAFT_305304 [Aspergillus keveii]|uniref:Uncharacterized protein n=1 Tax=Aspergillus keveii TaxID=714993 RepID=A0ABR4G4E4_9EURO